MNGILIRTMVASQLISDRILLVKSGGSVRKVIAGRQKYIVEVAVVVVPIVQDEYEWEQVLSAEEVMDYYTIE